MVEIIKIIVFLFTLISIGVYKMVVFFWYEELIWGVVGSRGNDRIFRFVSLFFEYEVEKLFYVWGF